jgi:hypothetical protein
VSRVSLRLRVKPGGPALPGSGPGPQPAVDCPQQHYTYAIDLRLHLRRHRSRLPCGRARCHLAGPHHYPWPGCHLASSPGQVASGPSPPPTLLAAHAAGCGAARRRPGPVLPVECRANCVLALRRGPADPSGGKHVHTRCTLWTLLKLIPDPPKTIL